MKKVLTLNDVCLTYHTLQGETDALSHLNLEVEEGEFVGIVGPSGCGKTTILSLIAGILSPSSGSILLEGGDTNSLKCGYMLQKDHLLDWRTIYKNILLGLEIQGRISSDSLDYVADLLNKYGLKEFSNSYPHQLSGGMRQRVALIRTLALKPSILLLDEPFSALDYVTRLSVCDDVHSIIKQEKKTAILVTHDISEAISLCDRVVVLSHRPATVKYIHHILIEGEPLVRRKSPNFAITFDKIWKELDIKL
ncbi:MAG: ABC transporter ATP-binding protein [Clostridia bacterium]|nr:ABC transporter ATP-binding protein [Clostridia bacterium]